MAALGADDMARDAVERCLERISEAGHRLGNLAAKPIPGHPWDDIGGMDNQLRHAYHRIDMAVIWNAPRFDAPALAADVRKARAAMLAAEDPPDDKL